MLLDNYLSFLPNLHMMQLGFIFASLISGFAGSVLVKKKVRSSGLYPLISHSKFFLFLFTAVALCLCLPISLFLLDQDASWIQFAFFVFSVLAFSSLLKVYIKNRMIRYSATSLAWLAVLFHSAGLLTPSITYLKSVHFQLGSVSISLLGVLKALFSTGFLIYGATVSSNYLAKKLKKQKHVETSIQLLITKIVKTLLVTISIFIGLSLIGIDLSVFSIFAGAIGVGVAFSLQNIFSNYFSGFVILMDRSIKPGDVISLDEGKTYGIVNKLYSRYVSIRTREGKEHLIPNQAIISNKLENWSYSDPHIRMEILFKVAYDSDLQLVEDLLVTIAKKTNRVKTNPIPYVRFCSLVDNAVDLKLRLWVIDPQNGTSGIQSDIIFEAWKAFQKHGIRVPYPPLEVYPKQSHEILEQVLNAKLDPS